MDQDFQFFNIAPFSPGEEKQLAQDMIEYTQRTGNRVVLYSLTLHPEGFPAMKKALFLIDSYRKLKAELQGTPVQLGVLIQAIIGHWPRVDKDEEPWTRSINIDGEAKRFCPLDAGFQKYISDVVTLLAREKPVFILGDDDIRSFSPRPECFCELHTREFNRRNGTNFTSDQYRKAVLNSQVGDKIYTAYDQLRRETVNGVAKLIRQAIDQVDPTIPAGTCMPGQEFRFNGETSLAMAGNNPAWMRICNANYFEGPTRSLNWLYLKSQVLREVHKNIPHVLDEADTCPHNLYSRASISMHAKLCSSIMAGLNGAKIWFVNAHKNGYEVTRNYTDILAKNRGLYQELTRYAAKSKLSGVIIPIHRKFLTWHPDNPQEFFLEPGAWNDILGVFGVPFYATCDLSTPGIYALAGEQTIARFSDEELRQILSHQVLLDGLAAKALSQRGFSNLMGVTARDEDFRFNREKDCATNHNLPVSKAPQAPHLTDLAPQAEVLTMLGYSPFSSSTAWEAVAPGTVLFKNALGGTVCTTTYHFYMPFSQFNAGRKLWLLNILDRLAGGKFDYTIGNDQNIFIIERKNAPTGDLLYLCNLNFDPLVQIKIRCAHLPQKVEQLQGDGSWLEVKFTIQNDEVIIPCTMACYETQIYRFR